jgi:hypothetical protein
LTSTTPQFLSPFNESASPFVNHDEIAFSLVFWVMQLTTQLALWTETEFGQLDLGDARLDKQAPILMERLVAESMMSVPKACNRWGVPTLCQ